MQGIRNIRVPSTLRLAKHTHCRYWNKPRTTPHGRRCKTLLLVAGSLLQPNFSTEEDTRKLIGTKERQQHYYNKQTKPLEPISVGETVRMRPPGETTWSPGTCTATAGPRSYRVQVGNTVYRRNQRQLIKTGEPEDIPLPELIIPDKSAPTSADAGAIAPPGKTPPSEVDVTPRRSQRQIKPPWWLTDFVTPR